jgi:hypothetical protein
VETSKSSHFIHLSEPETLVRAVQRVMAASSTRVDLDRFIGEHPRSPAFKITITRDGDRLFAQATGQQAFPLYSESATTFSLRVVDATMEFQVDAAGAVTGLVVAQNGQRVRAAKSP